MRIRQVYEVLLTPADTPGVAWQDIGPLRHKGGIMRPSELVLEFRVSRGSARFRGGRIIGRRVLARGRLGIHFAEEVVLIERLGGPDWLSEAVNLAAAELATKVKAGAIRPAPWLAASPPEPGSLPDSQSGRQHPPVALGLTGDQVAVPAE